MSPSSSALVWIGFVVIPLLMRLCDDVHVHALAPGDGGAASLRWSAMLYPPINPNVTEEDVYPLMIDRLGNTLVSRHVRGRDGYVLSYVRELRLPNGVVAWSTPCTYCPDTIGELDDGRDALTGAQLRAPALVVYNSFVTLQRFQLNYTACTLPACDDPLHLLPQPLGPAPLWSVRAGALALAVNGSDGSVLVVDNDSHAPFLTLLRLRAADGSAIATQSDAIFSDAASVAFDRIAGSSDPSASHARANANQWFVAKSCEHTSNCLYLPDGSAPAPAPYNGALLSIDGLTGNVLWYVLLPTVYRNPNPFDAFSYPPHVAAYNGIVTVTYFNASSSLVTDAYDITRCTAAAAAVGLAGEQNRQCPASARLWRRQIPDPAAAAALALPVGWYNYGWQRTVNADATGLYITPFVIGAGPFGLPTNGGGGGFQWSAIASCKLSWSSGAVLWRAQVGSAPVLSSTGTLLHPAVPDLLFAVAQSYSQPVGQCLALWNGLNTGGFGIANVLTTQLCYNIPPGAYCARPNDDTDGCAAAECRTIDVIVACGYTDGTTYCPGGGHSPVPCPNGRKCSPTTVCPAGRAGPNCDECGCVNGGVCTGSGPGVCACPVGYAGLWCQTDVDECASQPCANGGLCVDGRAAYNCTCAVGWADAQCTTPNTPCADGFSGVNCADSDGDGNDDGARRRRIGIAVGVTLSVVFGVALLGGALWWMRRRRLSMRMPPSADSDGSTDAGGGVAMNIADRATVTSDLTSPPLPVGIGITATSYAPLRE